MLLTVLSAPVALGQLQYQQIKSFGFPEQSGIDARNLIEGSDGKLYGMTGAGGLHGYGTVFTVKKDGSGYRVLHAFPETSTDGRSPLFLLEGSDGVLYGTTPITCCGTPTTSGTVFRLNKDGTSYTLLRSFTDFGGDGSPLALVEGSDGSFFGTTAGGRAEGFGTVFKLNRDGSGYSVLHSFTGPNGDGKFPWPLIAGRDGVLYGVTRADELCTVFRLNRDGGGFAELLRFTETAEHDAIVPYTLVEGSGGELCGITRGGGPGTVFKLNKDGSGYSLLHNFTLLGGDGGLPLALVSGRDQALYGMCQYGGAGFGAVFRLNNDGSGYTNLHSFTGAGGDVYGSYLVEGRDGVLYSPGFRLNKDGSDFAVLHRFTYSGGDGSFPTAPLVEGRDGVLYGTTSEGWDTPGLGVFDEGGGTVFKLYRDGTGYTLLHQFDFPEEEAYFGHASVIEGSDGILYGTASREGTNLYGTVFKLNYDGSGYIELRRFSGAVLQQGEPHTTLLEGSDGALYGSSYPSGTNNAGMVFKLNKDATGFMVLHEFGAIAGDASRPYGPLVEGSNGALYGTGGTVFKLNKDGTAYTMLPITAGPAALVEGSDGALYGTSAGGGTDGVGAVFKFNLDGSGYAMLHSFTLVDGIGVDGVYPSTALLEGTDGALYGTTREGGTRFSGTAFNLNKDGSGFTVLHNFAYTGVQGGAPLPYASLSKARDGAVYGVTAGGGEMGIGNIFVLRPTGPRLTLASILPGGQFRYTLLGEAGRSYTIQVSTDLVNWTALTNFQSTTGTDQLTDPTTPNYNPKFYRAVSP
jgi:uncharacterized repeat protein (TIGR03803 family)